MAEHFDPYHTWLGIPQERQPPNHYDLLGIPLFEDDPDVIEAAADRQMSHLRTYQTGRRAPLSQKLLNEVAGARTCLLNADKKAAYEIRKGGPNPPSKANHKNSGRITLYQDGHVKWTAGPDALDPDESDDEIGKPGAADYADWWSDPPFYGE